MKSLIFRETENNFGRSLLPESVHRYKKQIKKYYCKICLTRNLKYIINLLIKSKKLRSTNDNN